MSFNQQLNRRERMLCGLVADSDDSLSEPLDLVREDAAFWRMAAANEVETHVAHALRRRGEASSDEAWRKHSVVDDRIQGYLAEAEEVAERMHGRGIPLAALKNVGIAHGIYPCRGCSPMGDIDLMVSRRHFREAHSVLLEMGYELEFRSEVDHSDIEAAELSGGAEYRRTLPSGDTLWLELQWRPVAGRWIRPDQEPDAEDLLARAAVSHSSHLRLLAPEDNLLQVALHTAKHSYVRAPGFRLHTDVDRIVRRLEIDWSQFIDMCRELHVRTAVYFSLRIPAELFKTPVPAWVLDALRPHPIRERLIERQLLRAGVLYPEEKKFSKLGFIVFTAFLYDNFAGLIRAVFPSREWMMDRYRFKSPMLLPYYHLRRLVDLLLRRATV